MSEHFEHNPNDHEDPVAGSTWIVGVVGTIVLLVTILGVAALYYAQAGAEFEEQNRESEVEALRTLRAAQQQVLDHWVTDSKSNPTRFGMPIEQAMDLYLEEAQTRQN